MSNRPKEELNQITNDVNVACADLMSTFTKKHNLTGVEMISIMLAVAIHWAVVGNATLGSIQDAVRHLFHTNTKRANDHKTKEGCVN